MGCCATVHHGRAQASIAAWLPLPLQQLVYEQVRLTHPAWSSRDNAVVALQVELNPGTDGLDPEVVDRLHDILSTVIQETHLNGGYVASCSGMHCLSIFSTNVRPTATIHDLAMRAVHLAGLLSNRRSQTLDDLDRTLEARCGVAIGQASTALVGGRAFWQWLAAGPVIFEIAECIAAAKPRQTVVNEAVAILLEGVLLSETLKGGRAVATGLRLPISSLLLPRTVSRAIADTALREELLQYLDPQIAAITHSSQITPVWDNRDALVLAIGLHFVDGDLLLPLHLFMRQVQEVVVPSKGCIFNCLATGHWLRILVLFEWKDVSRALLAALRLQVGLADCHGAAIGPVSIGIARGPVSCRAIGSLQTHIVWTAIGMCVLEACRLMRVVGSSTIVCSQTLFPQVQDTGFHFLKAREKEPVIHLLEGYPKLFPYWDSRLQLSQRTAPCVEAFTVSLAKVFRAMDQNPESLTIVKGEAGIGKSTFLATLYQTLVHRKFSVVWCQGRPEAGSTSYAPWLPVVLRILTGRRCVTDLHDLRDGIQSTMTQWFGPPVRKHLPLLNFLTGAAMWESSEDAVLPVKEREARLRHLLFRVVEEWCDSAKSTSTGMDTLTPLLDDHETAGSPRVRGSNALSPKVTSNAYAAARFPPDAPSLLDLPGSVSMASPSQNFPPRSATYGPRPTRSSPWAPQARVLLVDHIEAFDAASLRLLGLAMQIRGFHIVVAGSDFTALEEAAAEMRQSPIQNDFLKPEDHERPPPRPPLDRFERATFILLGPMSLPVASQTLQRLLHVNHVPEEVAGIVYECCNGNPAIFMQVVQSLMERRVLPQRSLNAQAIERDPIVAHLKAAMPKGTTMTPKKRAEEGMGALASSLLSAAIAGRLDAFLEDADQDTHVVLQTAAIIGHEFSLRELLSCIAEEVLGIGVLNTVVRLCQVGYLFCVDWSEKQFQFVHARHREHLEAVALQKPRVHLQRLLCGYYMNRDVGPPSGFFNRAVNNTETTPSHLAPSGHHHTSVSSTDSPTTSLSLVSNRTRGSLIHRSQNPVNNVFFMAVFRPSKITYRGALFNPLEALLNSTKHCISVLGKAALETPKVSSHIRGSVALIQSLGHHTWAVELLVQALHRLDRANPSRSLGKQLSDNHERSQPVIWKSENGVDEVTDDEEGLPEESGFSLMRNLLGDSSELEERPPALLLKKRSYSDHQGSLTSMSLDPVESRETFVIGGGTQLMALRVEFAYIALQSARLVSVSAPHYSNWLRIVSENTPSSDTRWFYALFAKWFVFGYLGEDTNELGLSPLLMECALGSTGRERDRRLALALMAAVVAESALTNHHNAVAHCEKLVSLYARSPESCAPPPYIPAFLHSYMLAAVYGCRSSLFAGRYRMYARLLTSSWDACTRLWTRHLTTHLCLVPYLALQLSTVWLKGQHNQLDGLLDQLAEISVAAHDRTSIDSELLVYEFYQLERDGKSPRESVRPESHLPKMLEVLSRLEQQVKSQASGISSIDGRRANTANHLLMLRLVMATTLKDHKKYQRALEIIETAVQGSVSLVVPECLHPEFLRLKGDVLLLQRKVADAQQHWMDAIALALEYGANHLALRAGLRLLQHEDNVKNQKIVEGLMRKVEADMNVDEYAIAHRMTCVKTG